MMVENIQEKLHSHLQNILSKYNEITAQLLLLWKVYTTSTEKITILKTNMTYSEYAALRPTKNICLNWKGFGH